jgi:hypothetical protein
MEIKILVNIERSATRSYHTITNALNEMLKPAQHDKKNYVIPNLFRNLEFANDNELIASALVCFERSARKSSIQI